MIKVNHVWHHYGIRPILKDVTLEIPDGELVAVMGPNGMGKSTLLGLIGGIMHPIEGSIEIDGLVRRSNIDAEMQIRQRVFYLPDDGYLPIAHSGREFILATGRLYGIGERRLMEHVDDLINLFDLTTVADSVISSYSTGQKKKVSLCSALITEAPILILDEPFSGGLDSSALLAISQILKRLAERKDVTVVMAVPVPELVAALAHKVAVIADGELRAYDSPAALQSTYEANDLSEVLAKMLSPEVMVNLKSYLEN